MNVALVAPAAQAHTCPAERWLAVRHDTWYDYGAPVELAHHVAHLRPRETPWQRIVDHRLVVEPLPDGPLRTRLDRFGNHHHLFSHATVHRQLCVRSSFLAALRPPPAAPADGGEPWEAVAARLVYRAGRPQPDAVEFSLGSPLAPRDPALAALAAEVFTPGRPVAEAASALCALVHRRFTYRPLSTSVATGALQALALGQGVCQDFAHVMTGALRSLGLAARYVSGYLLTQPPEGQPRLVGADASHAWVAVWTGADWLALDPTNDVPAGLDHVTVAWGRDYGDVAPLRGVIRGGGTAVPQVAVTVEPVAAPPACPARA
jgi:transglutaminase-like putative cysteine protease